MLATFPDFLRFSVLAAVALVGKNLGTGPKEMSLAIPNFTVQAATDKLLPVGVHPATVVEVRQSLVAAFPGSTTRQQIFARWALFGSIVRKFLPVTAEYIDGSFVTDRLDPHDVDVSIWVDANDVLALSQSDVGSLRQLLYTSKIQYLSHAFLVEECSPGHSSYGRFVQVRDWTQDYWRNYKDVNGLVHTGVHKGYVKVI